jgi:hypothetical protein
MPCSLVRGYHCLRNLSPTPIYPEDGGDKFLQNFGNHLQAYMASQPRILQLTSSPTWEPQIFISVWIITANEGYTLSNQKQNEDTGRN